MMSLQNELESILIAAEKVVYDCNTVLDAANVPPVSFAAELPERIQGACDTRYEAGREDGIVQGEDMGRQAAYDAFWDMYQDGGNRERYEYSFASVGWTNETFKPKYDMRPTAANYMFSGSAITDLKKSLADAGVVLDFSLCTTITHFVGGAKTTTLGEVNTTAMSDLNYLFSQRNYLVYVDKVILKDDGTQTYGATSFSGLQDTIEIRFEGKFGLNANFSKSAKLSKASIESVVSALSDSATGQTATFSRTAVEAAFTADEWTALCATRSNWTIAKA